MFMIQISQVKLSDGAVITASSSYDDESVARAQALGYESFGDGENVDAMNRDHDTIHQALARLLGYEDSPTLRKVADGTPQNKEQADYEERVVFLFQAALNGRSIVGLLRNKMQEVRNESKS